MFKRKIYKEMVRQFKRDHKKLFTFVFNTLKTKGVDSFSNCIFLWSDVLGWDYSIRFFARDFEFKLNVINWSEVSSTPRPSAISIKYIDNTKELDVEAELMGHKRLDVFSFKELKEKLPEWLEVIQ